MRAGPGSKGRSAEGVEAAPLLGHAIGVDTRSGIGLKARGVPAASLLGETRHHATECEDQKPHHGLPLLGPAVNPVGSHQ